jgi:glycosyltransferase involved in cell wall biosynthesis
METTPFPTPAIARAREVPAPSARARDEPRCRIAHLHSTLGVYGAERWTLALLRHIDATRFPSMIVSIGAKAGSDEFHRMAVGQNIPAHHIAEPGRLNPRAIIALRRLLLRERIDILHTHGFKADVLGYLARASMPVRLVSTIHGWTAGEGLRIRAYEAISRAFLRRFDRIYPLSPELLSGLARRDFDPSKLYLIPNAVDLDGLDFQFNSRRPDDALSLLFVGRLCRPKGIFELLNAFARAALPAATRLRIVGDGPSRSELETLSRSLGVLDKVDFVGAVASIAPHLERSHGLVLPSYSEGVPRAVMEAFAAGVPVIGTAIPGIEQLVHDGETGLLVPVADVPALQRALERLAGDPGLAGRMTRNARRLVVERFSAQRMARDFEREYSRLCTTTP